MHEVQFYYKPKNGVSPDTVKGVVQGTDLAELCTESDRALIDAEWATLAAQGSFSKKGGLGSLHDTTNPLAPIFRSTDFMTYAGVSRTSPQQDPTKRLSGALYDAMRVSAVNAAVQLSDGSYLVHRRPYAATHVAGIVDASSAGLAHVAEGTIDFFQKMKQKLALELRIQEADITSAEMRSVHSAQAPDFSGLVDFKIRVPFDRREAERRLNPNYCSELFFPSEEELPAFVVDHFVAQGDMAGDGCATLISALPYAIFLDTVRRINASSGQRIFFGTLDDGIFVEQELLD